MVVDDHPIVLAGLTALVQSDQDLELVATARSAAEATAVPEEPDVALLDVHLPDGDGRDLIRQLRATQIAIAGSDLGFSLVLLRDVSRDPASAAPMMRTAGFFSLRKRDTPVIATNIGMVALNCAILAATLRFG